MSDATKYIRDCARDAIDAGLEILTVTNLDSDTARYVTEMVVNLRRIHNVSHEIDTELADLRGDARQLAHEAKLAAGKVVA